MRRILLGLAAGCWLATLSGPAAADPGGTGGHAGCGHFGTSVYFVDSPSEAGRLARKEQKLLFVLHVSGHFEDPKFT